MILTLIRDEFSMYGVFGRLFKDGGQIAVTLEHSYDGNPKIPEGTYLCKRGMHRLVGMIEEFETFEITGVVGHSGLLFHVGNYNKDSEGCVLLGLNRSSTMISASRYMFEKFMGQLMGVNEFQLQIYDHHYV